MLLVPLVIQAKPDYESDQLVVDLTPRTPQQIAAFYEGRGFSDTMIDLLREQCFITVFIENKSRDIIWLNLEHWQFTNADGSLIRRDRRYWKARWQKMDIPLAHQSTFRWTLLPEQLNFLPDEREGGNIILPREAQPFTLSARFDTGEQREGTPIEVKLENLRCADHP
ncbi:hypothetical protein [Thiohalophilus sp.]|uniref:hypothetical protein n=1 Tax=Thiohalophilus sp. TaxID=3028392 RepID=UPI003975C05E